MRKPLLISFLWLTFLYACAFPPAEKAVAPQPTATELTLSTLTDCDRPGTLGSDRVPAPTQGFDISFRYYLPPCYAELPEARYPVIYLILMPFENELSASSQAPMSLAERLIRAGEMPPAIIVVPDDTIGYGYHAALAKDLVPYVDGKFRTLADRHYRGVGGISHGAAIAARMAFEFPATFGSVGLFSGGIDASETERFDGWIGQTLVEARPRVLVSVGEQDSIRGLTSNFLNVLDANEVPYALKVSPGGHSWDFWSANMESYLLWFADAW